METTQPAEGKGSDEAQEVELGVYPRARSLFELLDGGFTMTEVMGRFIGFFPREPRALGAAMAPWRMFRAGEPLAIMPSALVP